MISIEEFESVNLWDALWRASIWVKDGNYNFIKDVVTAQDADTGDWTVRIYYSR